MLLMPACWKEEWG